MADDNTTSPSTSSDKNLPPESIEAAQSATSEISEETPIATKNAESSSTPDLPSEPVDANASATTNYEGRGTPDLPKTTAQLPPSTLPGDGQHIEHRSEPRIHVKWHAEALVDGHGEYPGLVKDISLAGANILLDQSLQKIKFIKLHIHVPPINVISDARVMEVSGKVVYTVYDSNEFFFRTSVNFLQFNLESDLAYLRSRIANR